MLCHGSPPVQRIPVGEQVSLGERNRLGKIRGAGSKQDHGRLIQIVPAGKQSLGRLSFTDQIRKRIFDAEPYHVRIPVLQRLHAVLPGAGIKDSRYGNHRHRMLKIIFRPRRIHRHTGPHIAHNPKIEKDPFPGILRTQHEVLMMQSLFQKRFGNASDLTRGLTKRTVLPAFFPSGPDPWMIRPFFTVFFQIFTDRFHLSSLQL